MSESSALSPSLIAVLRCPETQQPLQLATGERLARITEEAARNGNKSSLEGALVREDGLVAYPVQDGFPILLISEAIPLPPTTSEPSPQ